MKMLKMNFFISIFFASIINSLAYILFLYYFIFVLRYDCQFDIYNMVFIPSTWFLLFSSTYTANKLANFIYFAILKPPHIHSQDTAPFSGYFIFLMITFLAIALFLGWHYPSLGPPELCNL